MILSALFLSAEVSILVALLIIVLILVALRVVVLVLIVILVTVLILVIHSRSSKICTHGCAASIV